MMRINTLLYLFTMVLFLACSKDDANKDQKTFEYWNNLVNEKYGEINTLVQSVPCTNIDEFEIIKKEGYYLVHPSIRKDFDKLQAELEQLEEEKSSAASREGWIGGPPPRIPSHPLGKVCDNGKPKLVYVNDLSMEEINAGLPVRYNEIKTFYKDVPCTDASQWIGRYILSDCDVEAVAVHKTIQNEEMLTKIDIYNAMMAKKMHSENKNCIDALFNIILFQTEPVQCKDGKPVVTVE